MYTHAISVVSCILLEVRVIPSPALLSLAILSVSAPIDGCPVIMGLIGCRDAIELNLYLVSISGREVLKSVFKILKNAKCCTRAETPKPNPSFH